MPADVVLQQRSPSAAGAEADRERRQIQHRWLLLSPALLIIVSVGIAPLGIILVYSLLTPGAYGGVDWVFSFEAYVSLFFGRDIFDDTLVFNSAYLSIYGRSLFLALATTCGTLLLGFPTAYFIATRPPAQRDFWVLLITVPFWTNLLIRTYAMLLLIRDEGVINHFLLWLGVIDEPIIMIYTDFGVALGLLYSFLPFMVLPIYASLERLDFRLVEAGADLFASRRQILRRIIVPLSTPGIVAGSILVFIPCLGAFITPAMLGGGKQLMIGNLIQLQFASARNWPFGSAAALVLMALVLIALTAYASLAAKSRQADG